jgi:hypothetical protein
MLMGAMVQVSCEEETAYQLVMNSIVRWNYGDDRMCECGEEETEELFQWHWQCTLYREARGEMMENWR